MRFNRTLGLLIVACVLAGCQSPPPPAAPPQPVGNQEFPAIKSSYEQANPNATIGSVTAVRSQDALVAVSNLNIAKVSEGDPVSVVDAKFTTVALGTVKRIDKDSGMAAVSFDSSTGTRAPQVGDMVIRAK